MKSSKRTTRKKTTARRKSKSATTSKSVATKRVAPFIPSTIEVERLRTEIKPFTLHYFTRLNSTNDRAIEMRRDNKLYAPAIVLTPAQMAGRGRGTNKWWSRRGVLTITFAMPIDEQVPPNFVPLMAGLAVRDSVASMLPGHDIQLKWPNDIYIDGKKLAGLLCERTDKVDLIGLGLNVNFRNNQVPDELQHNIVSMSATANSDFNMTDVIVVITRCLQLMFRHQNEMTFAQLLRRYDEHHALIGRKIIVGEIGSESPIMGKCEGLDSSGRLLVRDRKVLHRIIAGHVRLAE